MNFFYKLLLVFVFIFSKVTVVNAQLNTIGKVEKTLSSAEKVVGRTSEIVNTADAVFEKIRGSGLYKSLIDGKEFLFPIGILPSSGDENYALAINKVFMTPEGMFAEIFMKIPVGSNKHLYFIADKVPFSRSGGIAGDLRLYLLRTDSITVGKGYNIVFTGLEAVTDPEQSCFVTFNCKGFKDATLTGMVNFNKSSIVKDGDSKEQVSVKYYIQADKLSNFIIKLDDIPTFEFTNLPGFKCSVPSITLDKSDIKNAPNFALPSWYKDSIRVLLHDQTLAVDGVEWEGIYIPSISMDIPKSFKEDNPNQVVAVNVQDLIIDQNGVTFLSSASNLLSGKLKSWEYTIDYIEVDLIASSLSKAEISGGMTLPISKKESQVGYTLLVSKKMGASDLSYYGRISIERDGGILDAQAFGVAKIKLASAILEFEYTNKQFYPSATLTGSITIGPKKKDDNNGKPIASFGLEFALLKLSTKAPYLDVADAKDGGYVKMSTQGSMMSNFPVSISELGIKKGNGGQRFGIFMTLDIKLQKSGGDSKGGNGFSGSASFTVWAARDAATQKWTYDGFDLDKIVVDVNNSSFSIHGEISRFTDDVVYGTGFCGYLDLKIIKKLEVKVAAIFGRKGELVIDINNPPTDASMADGAKPNEYRYWFVDASVTLPAIPIGPMIGINGFTGGLYHNMHLERTPDPKAPQTTVDCKTASGMRYIPDDQVFLGLLAGIGLQSIPTDAVFNGTITFSLEFNNNGGLNMVALWGGVTLITPPLKVPAAASLKDKMDNQSPSKNKDAIKTSKPETSTGSIRVTWFTQYDVPKETFIGDFDVYIDVANIVTGIGDGGKAGHIAVMFSPAAKYVYMGIPLDPIGIDVLNLFKCTSYFCAGSKLPVPPIAPLPPEIHPSNPIDYNAMETGAGLSFGARVEVDGKFGAGGDLLGCDLWVGAELWVKAGFDLLITRTNNQVICDGYGVRGIDNWYATGQAFLAGGLRVGLDYDCGILGSGTKNLLSATLTAYVFAQLPKPSYLVGEISLDFEILSIDGHANVKVKLGDECKVTDANKNIVFISSILPDSASINIPVTQQIVVNFAKPIGTFKFNLPDESGSGTGTIEYWASVEDHNIKISNGGKALAFSTEWNSNHTSLRISPTTVLPEGAVIKVEVDLFLKNAGNTTGIKSENRTITFTTAIEPVKIEVSNVAYAYPLPSMKNYYKSEYNTGYVKLFTLPKKPMRLQPDYAYNVVFLQGGTEVARVTAVTVTNQPGVEQFVYTIPNEKFENDKTYTFQICKVNTNVQQKDDKDQDNENITLGYNNVGKDSVILEYDFTTSRFSSFSQKLSYYNQSVTEVSGALVTNSLSPNSADVESKKAEDFTSEETYGYTAGAIKTTKPLFRSVGADFSNGFPMTGAVPDSVKYSFYAGKLVVQYNVFSEIDAANKSNKQTDIVCVINPTNANCSNTSAAGANMVFPKAVYFYKLGYFLPGRNTKTSEVLQSFTLPEAITLSY
jgi:hypothetical protein